MADDLEARIEPSKRFGYWVHLRDGISKVGEVPMHAWTRDGAERKAQRWIKRTKRRKAKQRSESFSLHSDRDHGSDDA